MEKQRVIRHQPGPIAQKLIRSATKLMKNKIIDINAWKSAKSYNAHLQKIHLEKDLSHLNPLHALYMDTQHRIVDFVEQFSTLPVSNKFNKSYETAEDTYMPSGPPMSPLTKSYFWCWAAFDMTVGLKRETYASIMIDCCKSLGANSELIMILEQMQQSRMGLYINEGNDGAFVNLRELYTNKMIKTHSGSEYLGSTGEIWLVRLLPDPIGTYVDYSVAFTTPYVIIDYPLGRGMNTNLNKLFYAEKDWLDFIDRNLSSVKCKDMDQAYYYFMKYGLNKLYWPEYIFQAYVNHTSNAIWLTGFPDKPETLPHAGDNYEEFDEKVSDV